MDHTKDLIISTVDVEGSLRLQFIKIWELIFHVNFICFNEPDLVDHFYKFL